MSKRPDPDIEEAKLLYLADIISIREDNERLKKRVNELDMKNWQLTKEISMLRKREKERKERLAARRAERSKKEVQEVHELKTIEMDDKPIPVIYPPKMGPVKPIKPIETIRPVRGPVKPIK